MGDSSEGGAARNSAAVENSAPVNGEAPNSADEKSVADFLRAVDAFPAESGVQKLRELFVELNRPEKTDKEFLSGLAFRNILRIAIRRCKDQPSKAKTHIREVIDNMRLNAPKAEEERAKLRQKQRRRINDKRTSETVLERAYLTLDIVQRKIRAAQLREESDEDDSSVESNYVYTDRLQKRALDLYMKIQQLEGNRVDPIVDRNRSIVVRSSECPEINRALTKMTKRCLKRHMTPDFHDVFTVVKRISEEDNLGMSEEKKRSVALSSFKEIIDQIKTIRLREMRRNMESLEIELNEEDAPDPAAESEDLRQILDKHAVEAQQKIDSVINSFADRQANGRVSPDGGAQKRKKSKAAPTNGAGDGDTEGPVEDGEPSDGESGEDSDQESEIDEKYLDTGSSEAERSETEECEVTEDIIRRYGQDRERPRVENGESTAAANGLSPTNGTAKDHSERSDSDSSTRKKCDDVIELSSEGSDQLEDEPLRIKLPRRVIPKRLSTLGRPVEKKARTNGDSRDGSADEAENNSPQEVIEISD